MPAAEACPAESRRRADCGCGRRGSSRGHWVFHLAGSAGDSRGNEGACRCGGRGESKAGRSGCRRRREKVEGECPARGKGREKGERRRGGARDRDKGGARLRGRKGDCCRATER